MNTEDTKVLEGLTLESVNFTDNPLPGHEITVVETNEATDAEPSPPQPPTLNRAQRRQLAKATRHQAAVQARHVRVTKIYYAPWARQEDRCPRCGLWALGPAPHRCQCKVAKRRIGVVS